MSKTSPIYVNIYKLLLTIVLLIGYRLLSFVTIPWIDTSSLSLLSSYSLFSYMNEFNGGTLSTLSVTAVGISAYISASIILQLLTFGIPKLEEISRQPGGEKYIKKITTILGMVLSFITSIGLVLALNSQLNILTNSSWYVILAIACIHCIGSGIAIWIGETITEKGFGNGISLLIALNIATSLPGKISGIVSLDTNTMLLIIGTMLLMFLMVIVLETTEARIPVVYSSRINNSYVYKTKDPYIPIKLNISSVMPIIFASTIFQLITTIIQLTKIENIPDWLTTITTYGSIPYIAITCVLIFLFTFLYSYIIFKPDEVADQLQINEGAIPGIRPGTDTEKYLIKVIRKLNFIGATYMCVTALIPMLFFKFIGYSGIQVTSLIIVVGVGLEFCTKFKIEFFYKPSKKIFDIRKFETPTIVSE